MTLVLRCYCCGEPLKNTLALVSTFPGTVDRVFVFIPDHVENIDNPNVLLVSAFPPFEEDSVLP